MVSTINCNPTIVAALEGNSCFALTELPYEKSLPVKIRGAGFQPEESLIITICEKNLKLGKIIANKCGAFTVQVTVPSLGVGSYSIKALNGQVVRAAWPIEVLEISTR